MKSVLMIVGAVIIILLMGATLDAINDFRMTDREESYAVTTGANTTSGTLTLAQPLYNDATYNVTSLSSNVTADAPVAASYVSATQVLTVSGLEASNTRLITIDYKIDGLREYIGASTGAAIWPIMLVIGVIGIVAGSVYNAWRSKE